MKDFEVVWAIPNVLIKANGKTKLISSMILSTLSVCILATFVPQLMPLWMAGATRSPV